MSENENRLRTYIRQVAPHSCDMEGGGFALLDALLAEHRAEVETVKDELKRANQSWSATRDAALEEAAGRCEAEPKYAVMSMGSVIRALKSQPSTKTQARCECGHLLDVHHSRGGCAACGCAQFRPPPPEARPAGRYLPESEVREVLARIRGFGWCTGEYAADRAAADLCVDLDAKGEQCQNMSEPALDAKCARCGGSYAIHKKDGRRTAWDGHRETVVCTEFTP